MTQLARQVCLNHPGREAVARCVECARTFCRECITDHDGRLVCASCLGRLARPAEALPRRWPVRAGAKALTGFLLAWFLFYSFGRTLLQLPSAFHEDSFWNATWERLKNAGEP